MAKLPKCQNCGYPADDVKLRGERELCRICAMPAMPGLYAIGGKGEHTIAATVMRQVSYCTNLIIDEIRRLHGDGRADSSPGMPRRKAANGGGRPKHVRNVAAARKGKKRG